MADDEVGVVGSAGDSFLIAFASAVDAVACAIVWQSACAEAAEAQPAGQRMLFRIGIHLGDVIPEGGTIYADAARLEKLAQPLPFSNMSGDKEQEYFSDGITEDIITELSRFRREHVAVKLRLAGLPE